MRAESFPFEVLVEVVLLELADDPEVRDASDISVPDEQSELYLDIGKNSSETTSADESQSNG